MQVNDISRYVKVPWSYVQALLRSGECTVIDQVLIPSNEEEGDVGYFSVHEGTWHIDPGFLRKRIDLGETLEAQKAL